MNTEPTNLAEVPRPRPGKFYRAELADRHVTANDAPLDPGHGYVNLAAQFDWGRPSPGCRQLAFAILYDHLGDAHRALQRHEQFAEEVLARLPHWVPFCLAPGYVEGWLRGEALLPGETARTARQRLRAAS